MGWIPVALTVVGFVAFMVGVALGAVTLWGAALGVAVSCVVFGVVSVVAGLLFDFEGDRR